MFALAFGFIADQLQAQLYFSVHPGYGLKKSTQAIEYFSLYNETETSSEATKYEQILTSYGKGLDVGVTVGNMFNDNVGAELIIDYLLGGKTKATYEPYNASALEAKTWARMLRISPCAVIRAGFDGIDPYARFGAIVCFGSIKYKEEYTFNNQEYVYLEKLSGGVTLGFTGAVGARFPFSDNMAIFAEINTVNASYAPKKGEVTEFTIGGENQLDDMPTYYKETEFVKEYTYSGGEQNIDKPQQVLKQKFPFGSVGINVGFEITL